MRFHARAGTALAAGDELLQTEGDAAGVLLAWKTAQPLAEAMGGIASAAGNGPHEELVASVGPM